MRQTYHLADIDFLDELLGNRARGGEDGGSVTVAVVVGELDRLVQRIDTEADQHGGEYLLLVAFHVGFHILDDGGAKEISFLEARHLMFSNRKTKSNLHVTAIKDDLGSLIDGGLDEIFRALQGLTRIRRELNYGYLGADQRTDVRIFLETFVHTESLCTLDKLWNPGGILDMPLRKRYHFLASPTKTAVDNAMHRCPAAPKAAPVRAFNVWFLLASGMMTP